MASSSTSSGSSTSSSLIRAVQTGEDEAWGRFVGLYGPRIYARCRDRGLSQADAPDVMQEILGALFLRLSMGKFVRRRRGSLRKYLHQVTHGKVVDWFRRRSREVPTVGGSDAEQQLKALMESDEFEAVDDQEANRFDALHAAVQHVRDVCTGQNWEIFENVVIQGLPVVEVAEKFSVTPGSVSQTVYRLKKMIRDFLQADGEREDAGEDYESSSA